MVYTFFSVNTSACLEMLGEVRSKLLFNLVGTFQNEFSIRVMKTMFSAFRFVGRSGFHSWTKPRFAECHKSLSCHRICLDVRGP